MAGKSDETPVICIHEDRANCLTGTKLTVLSLREICPTFAILVSCPSPPASFVEWLQDFPAVKLVSYPETQNFGWNAKPNILLRLLDEGHPEVIWVDSDIIVHRDVLTGLVEQKPETLGGAEETFYGQNQGGTARTVAWGLTPGRDMVCTINSGVLRVTAHHIPLLRAWEQMLKHPLYIRAQSLPWYECPLHMVSDQEVLTAILGSQEFCQVPIALLRRGVEIAQCLGPAGFTPCERIRSMFLGLPGLIHSMGIKPWSRIPLPPRFAFTKPQLDAYYRYLHMELTPYVTLARKYGPALKENLDWTEPVSVMARFLSAMTANSAALQEFPLSVVDSIARRIRQKLTIARYSVPPEFCLTESPLKPMQFYPPDGLPGGTV